MKVATLRDGTRDGSLVVVSRDLRTAMKAGKVAPTLQWALDNWEKCAPTLERLYAELSADREKFDFAEAGFYFRDSGEPVIDHLLRSIGKFEFNIDDLMAPLPRAYQWVDASAYLSHVERVRKARGEVMPPAATEEPLMYQGGSDSMLGAHEPIKVSDEAWEIDLEAEVGVIVDDVPMTTDRENAIDHVRLLVLVNDVSLRNLTSRELEKGFGFFNSKSWTAFSPVAVTPDELGSAWAGGAVHLPIFIHVNDTELGRPNAGVDMNFDFATLIAHAAKTRPLGAGSIIGSGTVSNRNLDVGVGCIAEKRALEMTISGKPKTQFLRFGDRIKIEMFDDKGRSIFGAIDQKVTQVK
jgi:fumarylacetoacetate (FAA) hydrolase